MGSEGNAEESFGYSTIELLDGQGPKATTITFLLVKGSWMDFWTCLEPLSPPQLMPGGAHL